MINVLFTGAHLRWARFDHVSIPRENMLGGVAQVSRWGLSYLYGLLLASKLKWANRMLGRDGEYVRIPGGDKRMYGAMLDVSCFNN